MLKMDDNEQWRFPYDVHVGNNVSFVNISSAHLPVDHALKAISAVTCSLSILGSLAIILSYVLIKDIRSKAREILVHLSIMDLTFTTANLIGIILQYDKYLVHQTKGSTHDNYKRVCEAQAFFAAYGTIGSILWTLGMAVYLYYRITSPDQRVTGRVVKVLYVVCYVLPLYVSLWLLIRGHYGYPKNENDSGGWCTIRIGSGAPEHGKYDEELLLFMVDDIWILFTFMTMVPIYLIIHCEVRTKIKESGHQYMLSSGKKHLSLLRADQKFLLVPLGFMILRVWDIVISILYVYSQPHDTDQDETEHYKPLVYLNAIGDSGQGFLNFIFFCVLQGKVRQYTLKLLRQYLSCKRCCKPSNKNCNDDIEESYTDSVTPSRMSNYSSDPPRSWYEE